MKLAAVFLQMRSLFALGFKVFLKTSSANCKRFYVEVMLRGIFGYAIANYAAPLRYGQANIVVWRLVVLAWYPLIVGGITLNHEYFWR